MKTIDARGYSCPEPVLMTRRGIADAADSLTVLCDTEVSKENVSRFLKDAGYTVEAREIEDYFEILAKRKG